MTGLAIQPRRTANWDAQLLKIPAVSPSIINCCLIKVEYAVRITLQIPLIAYNLSVDLPIVVGTVPLRAQTSNNRFADPLMRPSEARISFYPPVPPYSALDLEGIATTRKSYLYLLEMNRKSTDPQLMYSSSNLCRMHQWFCRYR